VRIESTSTRGLIERARALIGRRRRVYRINEQMSCNAKLQVRTADYGPDTDPVHEHSAKENLLATAEGDKETACRARIEAGLPESGSVSARQLSEALARLPLTDTL
jgi:hypothetical protein